MTAPRTELSARLEQTAVALGDVAVVLQELAQLHERALVRDHPHSPAKCRECGSVFPCPTRRLLNLVL